MFWSGDSSALDNTEFVHQKQRSQEEKVLGRAGQAQPDLTGPVPRGRAGRAIGNPSQRNKQREGLLALRLQHWGPGAVAFLVTAA